MFLGTDIIATDASQVGLAWLDFYSIGHLCYGIGVFLFFSLFYTIPKRHNNIPIFSLLFVFILTTIFAVLWELVENTVFIELGWKFEGRLDSWQNIISDIFFGCLGGLGSWLICYLVFVKEKNIWLYYIFGILGFALWIGVFIVLRALTLT